MKSTTANKFALAMLTQASLGLVACVVGPESSTDDPGEDEVGEADQENISDQDGPVLNSLAASANPRLRLRSTTRPERASLGMSTPYLAGASLVRVTLDVRDGDYRNEGELVINNQCTIPLFTTLRGNEVRFRYSFNIKASCLRTDDLLNDFLFVHTRTHGFDVYDITLTPVNPDQPEPRLRLRGTQLPEAASLGVKAPDLSGTSWVLVSIDGRDADNPNFGAGEGTVVINRNSEINGGFGCKIPLFSTYGYGDEQRFLHRFQLASFCLKSNAYNDFEFHHNYADGYDIFNVTLKPVN